MASTETAPATRDIQVIGLIGIAHATSHFFQLVVPSLFPLLRGTFGVGFTELGAVMTTVLIASGLAQTPCGFLVDRLGARRLLLAGMALLAVSSILFGLVPVFWLMFPVAILAGLGNSVYHPADYAILTANISPPRLGRAYSVHNLGGNLGWAAAPVFVLPIAAATNWRVALVAAGCLGLLVFGWLFVARRKLTDPVAKTTAHPQGRHTLALIASRPVMLCFVYFTMLSITTVATNSFLPVTLDELHGVAIATGAAALTAFLIGGAAGMLAGGFLADWSRRHDAIVASGLLATALLFLLLSLLPLFGALLIGIAAAAGALLGITMPSRDMLVRRSAPEGAIGRVFGFVYSGLDTGAAIAPVVVGYLLDHGRPATVLWFSALALIAGVLSVTLLPRRPAGALKASLTATPHPGETGDRP